MGAQNEKNMEQMPPPKQDAILRQMMFVDVCSGLRPLWLVRQLQELQSTSIGLVQGKKYRNAPEFIGKTMVSCRFPLNQSKNGRKSLGASGASPTIGVGGGAACQGWIRDPQNLMAEIFLNWTLVHGHPILERKVVKVTSAGNCFGLSRSFSEAETGHVPLPDLKCAAQSASLVTGVPKGVLPDGGFLKCWYPYIIHFNRMFGFSLMNHPFWGTPIYGNPQRMLLQSLTLRPAGRPCALCEIPRATSIGSLGCGSTGLHGGYAQIAALQKLS